MLSKGEQCSNHKMFLLRFNPTIIVAQNRTKSPDCRWQKTTSMYLSYNPMMKLESAMENLIDGASWGYLLLIAVGLLAVAGGLFNWDWYMTDRKAQFFVNILGRTGARVFYVLLGIVLIIVAVGLRND